MRKRVYRAADTIEAHIIVGMLQANGIDAYVSGHHLQGGVGELAAMDFAGVWVEEDHQDEALKVVEAYERGDAQTNESDADDWAAEPST